LLLGSQKAKGGGDGGEGGLASPLYPCVAGAIAVTV
jgi:hypothetical protein